MAKQINVFLENKPGRLKKITGILFHENINIRAFEIQDRGDFGMLKMLVNDPVRAHQALSNAGLAAATKDILAIEMRDAPGGLHQLAGVLEEDGINVLDGYAFLLQSHQSAVWCVEVTDPEKARRLLEQKGYRLLSDTELYEI